MRKDTFILIALFGILILSNPYVQAWTYQKIGQTYVVTLDTGKVVNVTNVTYTASTKTVSAVIKAKNLTIQDSINIKMIEQNISDSLNGKKNYSFNVIILNTK